jgi:CheY-specific phosphatase CheX
MQTSFSIEVYRADIGRIAASVFETMLGLTVEPAEMEWKPAADRVTAAIYLVGRWHGAVLLECSPSQACAFTQLLLSIEDPVTMGDDVRDTLGELANMLAGNLKSVLPAGVSLSVPSVTAGSDYTLRVCGADLVERVACSTALGVFWITLVEIAPRSEP